MKKLQESKKLKENVNWDFYNNKIKNMVHKYFPDREENETLASQIVDVIRELVYAWNNDGDVYDNVHSNLKGWINDISSYANWLYKYVDGTQDTLKKIYGMSNNKNDYENLLKEIVDKFLDDDFLAQAAKSKEEGNIYMIVADLLNLNIKNQKMKMKKMKKRGMKFIRYIIKDHGKLNVLKLYFLRIKMMSHQVIW